MGVHDSFFELGGHSLQGIRLLSRICDAFSVDLQLQALFEEPTVEGLAIAVAERMVEAADEDMVSELLAELERDEQPFSPTPSPVEELFDGGFSPGRGFPGMTETGR